MTSPTTEAPRGYSPEGEPWYDDGDAPGPRWALWDYEGRKWDKLPPGYDPEARAGLDVLRERAEYVVREYDKTHLTHDTAYESVAEGIDWLRIALDPTHPLYAALARQADHE